MNKYIVITHGLICFYLFAFLGGCGGQAEPPKQPQIVRKKIVAKTKQTRPTKKSKTKKLTQPSSISRPKSDISKTPTIKTSKEKPTPSAKPKMLAVKPKSEITKTPQVKEAPKIIAPKDQAPQPAAPEPIELKEKPLKLQKDVTKASSRAKDKSAVASAPEFSKASLKPHAPPAPYNPRGKIDPFEPLFKDQPIIVASKQKRKKRIPRTPLEKIGLGQLKLVGVILARSGNKALVQEASGKGYIIKKGTYIGLNSGQVVEIQKDNVIIEEEVEDVLGKVTTRKTELRLPKPPGE